MELKARDNHIIAGACLAAFAERHGRGKGGIPAYAGMTVRLGILGDGAQPRLWRLRAEWIPAYAGMTGRVCAPSNGGEVPAYAGMAVMGATRPVRSTLSPPRLRRPLPL